MGAYPGHSGKPMQAIGRQAARRLREGKVKIAIVDPVMAGGVVSPALENARWIPIKPATDGAFGMGMVRWIIENERYNEEYLSSPNLDAAREKGFNSWTNATHLVICDESHPNYRRLLRASDLGLESSDEEDLFIVMDENSKEAELFNESKKADLLFEGEVTGKDGQKIKVKTGFLILKESAFAHSLDEYANICGIPKDTIIELAKEWTSHGTKVAVDGLGGTATANGLDLGLLHYVLPALVGSVNKKGGVITRRVSYNHVAPGPLYKLNIIPDAPENNAMRISRTGIRYEDTSEYKEKVARGENPYPSKLPWHPIGSAADSQALFSMLNKYPYQAKVFINWMANCLLSLPGAALKVVIDKLKDPDIIPLFISVDAYMAETTSLADYIIPDTTPYESWGVANIEGNFSGKGNTVRWPVVTPATAEIGDGRYACFENFVIDVAKKLDMPGFGDEGILDKDDKPLPLNKPEDFFLRAVANMAFDEEPVSDISEDEVKVQALDERVKVWKDVLKDEEWPKALYILSRGGRFEDYGEGYEGDDRKYAHEGCVNIYIEDLGSGKNSFTGKYFDGVAGWHPEAFADGTLLRQVYSQSEWPFKAANYKAKFRSVTMLANSPNLRQMGETNYVEINELDAKDLGIATGDMVKVTPATGQEFNGEALVRSGIARGTIGIAFGYGHWEYGARKHAVDSEDDIGGEDSIGTGVHLLNLLDPKVEGLFAFSESSSGGPGRNGGAYKVEKV